MGLWANTAYIHHADSRAVADGLTQLFEAEGMRSIPRPAQRERSSYEPIQYASGARNNLWGVAMDSAQNPDPRWYYGEPISMEHLSIEFRILPLQSVINNCEHEATGRLGRRLINYEMLARTLAKLLGGINARFCDNLTSVDTLICHKPLEAVGGRDLYFEWPPGDRDDGRRGA